MPPGLTHPKHDPTADTAIANILREEDRQLGKGARDTQQRQGRQSWAANRQSNMIRKPFR